MAFTFKFVLYVISTTALLCYVIGSCSGYPTGAPKQACATAAPQHHAKGKIITPQTMPSPYAFTVDAKDYTVGQKITVTISGSQPFGGFLVQARRASGGSDPVGSFSSPPANSKLLACKAGGDSVTHTNPAPKTPGMKLVWSATEAVGDVVFFGTVAKDHDTFWSNITSTKVQQATVTGQPDYHMRFSQSDTEQADHGDGAAWVWEGMMQNRTRVLKQIQLEQRLRDDQN